MFLDSFTQHYVFKCFYFIVSRCSSIFLSCSSTKINYLSYQLDVCVVSRFLAISNTRCYEDCCQEALVHTCLHLSEGYTWVWDCWVTEYIYVIFNSARQCWTVLQSDCTNWQAVNENPGCSVASPTLGILRLFHCCKSGGGVVAFH